MADDGLNMVLYKGQWVPVESIPVYARIIMVVSLICEIVVLLAKAAVGISIRLVISLVVLAVAILLVIIVVGAVRVKRMIFS